MNKDIHPDKFIDAKDCHSPIPLLRLKKELATMNSEEIVQIDCSDNDSGNDISSWCSRTKNTYLGKIKDFDYFSYLVQKK